MNTISLEDIDELIRVSCKDSKNQYARLVNDFPELNNTNIKDIHDNIDDLVDFCCYKLDVPKSDHKFVASIYTYCASNYYESVYNVFALAKASMGKGDKLVIHIRELNNDHLKRFYDDYLISGVRRMKVMEQGLIQRHFEQNG